MDLPVSILGSAPLTWETAVYVVALLHIVLSYLTLFTLFLGGLSVYGCSVVDTTRKRIGQVDYSESRRYNYHNPCSETDKILYDHWGWVLYAEFAARAPLTYVHHQLESGITKGDPKRIEYWWRIMVPVTLVQLGLNRIIASQDEGQWTMFLDLDNVDLIFNIVSLWIVYEYNRSLQTKAAPCNCGENVSNLNSSQLVTASHFLT